MAITNDLDKLPAIRNLTDDVRQKALEFADALGARGPRPTTTLGTAVTLANEWKSGRLPQKQGGPAVLVQPRNGRWIIRRSDSEHPTHTFLVREDAVRRAQEIAKRQLTACLVFGPGGTLIERYAAPGASAPQAVPALEPTIIPVAIPPVAAVVELSPEVVAPMVEPDAAVVIAPEPVAPSAPEAVVVALPEAVDEVVELAPVVDIEAPTIRVKKVGQRWQVFVGDGRTEAFATKQKANKRAKDLAASLACGVQLA